MGVIISILVCLLFSAFFSGMEIAFLSSNKLQIEIDRNENGISSSLLEFFLHNPGMYITTILVGNNAVMVIYGAKMTGFLQNFLGTLNLNIGTIILITTIISTLIIIVFAEFLPKALFKLRPNKLLKIFALPVFFFYLIFYPVSWLSVKIGSVLIWLFTRKKINSKEQTVVFGKLDLDNLLHERENTDEEDSQNNEIKFFKNALDFSKIKLRECIVPRTDVVAVPMDSSLEDLKELFVKTGYSRILVYEDSIDDIVGYIHISMLYKHPNSITDIISNIIIVPETMSAQRLLKVFITKHKSMAVVVDEFGITAGIVTMEDIMEEIFGEIEDEHDHQELTESLLPDGRYLFSGRLEVDYLNEKYHMDIPEREEYETLAGYILFVNESIPSVGDILESDGFVIEITSVDNARIEELKMKKI